MAPIRVPHPSPFKSEWPLDAPELPEGSNWSQSIAESVFVLQYRKESNASDENCE